MKKRKIKFLSFILSASMFFTSFTPVLAEEIDYSNIPVDYKDNSVEIEEYQNTSDENFTNTSNVFAKLASIYKVTIPKTIVLSGTSKKANYFVKVEGDIAGYEEVEVIPEEKFNLYSKGKDLVPASISQDKTSWKVSNFNIDANGLIQANDITAGKWTGTFNFNIAFKENGIIKENKLSLDVENENLAMGAGQKATVQAFYNGKDVSKEVTWTSDNENINVEDGVIMTSALAKPGDTANITAELENSNMLTAMLEKVGIVSATAGESNKVASFTVTIIEINFKNENNEIIDNIEILPGESAKLSAKLVPELDGSVSWSYTAPAGISLKKNRNEVEIFVSNDMPVGKKFNIIATYGDYSNVITLMIKDPHVHSAGDVVKENEIKATCTQEGSYDEVIYCASGDGYEISRVKKYTEKLPHDLVLENTIDSSCTKEGINVYKCKNCDYIKNEIIAVKEHTKANSVEENKVEPTCENKGSYDQVFYCAICKKELERNKKDIPAKGHSFGNYSDINGYNTRTCTVCGKTETGNIIDYKITYNLNNSNLSGQKTSYNVETDTFTLPIPTRTGYTFTGWTGSNGITKQTSVSITKGSTGNKEFTANFTPISYKITYNLNGGSVNNASNYTIEQEVVLNNPTKTGYVFAGWTGANGSSAQTNVKIAKGSTGDKTFTANWTESTNTKYTVIHQQEQLDGTYKTIETQNLTGTTNAKVKPAVKSYTGFTSPSVSELTIKADGTSSLTYKYTRNSYTVTCKDYIVDKDGKKYDEITDRITLKDDGKYTQRTVSVKYGTTVKGSDFGGDTKKEKYNSYTYVNCNSQIVTANNTVVERYFNATFDINIKIDNKTGNSYEEDPNNNNKKVLTSYDIYVDNVKYLENTNSFYGPIPYGAKVELKNVKTNSEYKITGYYSYDLKDRSVTALTSPIITMDSYRKEIHVYVDRIYPITYNLNSGSASNKTSYTRSDADFTLTNPTRTGYTFKGWSGTNLTGDTNTSVKITKGSTGSRSYTANWNLANYTITYNLNGGSIANQKTSYNITTDTFTLPTPTRTGYTFAGWTGSNGTTKQTSVSITKGSTGNKTYTANWNANTNTKYVVKHLQQNINDDNYTLKDTENLTGTTAASVTPNVKSYTGFKAPSKQTVTIKADGTTVVEYKYTRNKFSVVLVAGTGIKSVTGAGTYKYGQSVTIKAVAQDCATWVNWTGTNTQTNINYTFTMPNNVVTYTANGKANASATTHSWKVATSTAATCDADSTEAQVCEKCGSTKVTHNTKKLGHTAAKGKDVVTNPTCTAQGYTTHTCSRCSKTFVDTYKNALGHNYGSNGKCTRNCGAFDMSKMAAGLYTVSGSGSNTTYTVKYTWQQLLDKKYFHVNNGLLVTTNANNTTGASPNRNDITGFLVLPSTVTSMNNMSLYNLHLLTGIYLPKTMTKFNTVWALPALKDIYVDPANTSLKTINGALYSRDGKTLYLVPRTISGSFNINSGCTLIKGCAFQHTSYSTLNIPDSVTNIEGGAFRNMPNLSSLNISKYVTSLGNGIAVIDPKLTAVNIDGNNPNYTTANGVIYNKAMTTIIYVPSGRSGEFTIPSTVTRIEVSAFDGCSKMTKIVIPESVTFIGSWAFSSCPALTSVNIPSKITTINVGTFNWTNATVTIPANVTKIYNRNFQNGKSVTFKDTTHNWKLSLTGGGTAITGVPTGAFDVKTPSENGKKFKAYQYYDWTRQ